MKTYFTRVAQILFAALICAALLLPLPGSLRAGLAYSGTVVKAPASPLGTSFTYQGRLTQGGMPVDQTCDFQFGLWDDPSGGSPASPVIDLYSVPVSQGLFTVQLDFGGAYFIGNAIWLEIAVSCPAGGGNYTTLGRQAITAAPHAQYAIEAKNAQSLNGLPASSFQMEINGYCPDGWSITYIFSDGSVECQADGEFNHRGMPMSNFTFSLDNVGSIFSPMPSMTIGEDGLGLISYVDSATHDLKVLHCSDPECSTGTITSIDTTGNVGLFSSITIGLDGRGLISYYDSTNKALKVAHCENVLCSGATITTVDSAGFVGAGQYSSITIAEDGLGLISYFDDSNLALKVAHCTTVDCSTFTVNTVDDGSGVIGQYTSITLGVDGYGLISYYVGDPSYDLKVAHCETEDCSVVNITTLDSADNVGAFTSITIGEDGLGLISYYDYTNSHLKVAHCSDIDCTAATITTLDSNGLVGSNSSITIGADGLGLISYWDQTNETLKVAHCMNVICSSATIYDPVKYSVGPGSAITLGANGFPLISYYNKGNFTLGVLRCGSPFCVSYFRRR